MNTALFNTLVHYILCFSVDARLISIDESNLSKVRIVILNSFEC